MAKNKIPAWKLWDDSFTADDARRTREEMGIFPKQEDEENRLAELGSILTELEKEGLSQEQLSAVADQYMATGSFDVPAPAAPQSLADFSNVQSGVSSTEAEQRSTDEAPSEMSLLDKLSGIYSPGVRNLPQVGDKIGAVVDAAQAGGWRDLANVTERVALENTPSNTIGLAAMLGGQDLVDGNYDRLLSRFGRNAARPLAEDIAAMRNSAAANQAAADKVLAPIVEQGGAGGLVARTAQDAASSGLSSAVSLVGGPIGALTAGGVSYAGAYKEAVDAGASPAAAEVYALTQGGIEGLFSAIPAGKYLDKVPFLGALTKKGKDELLQKVTDPAIAAAVKTAKAVVGESAQESATGAMQDLVGAAVAGAVSNDELGKQHSSEGFWERREREALVGGAMGGTLTAPVAAASEASRYAKEMEDRGRLARAGAQRGALSERNRNAVDPGTVAEQEADFSGESQLDTLRRQGAERRKQAEIDAAYAQREAEQRAVREQELNIDEEIAATQKEVEEEAGFRTIERDAAAPSDRVERLPDGTVERVPVQPAAPVTAEQVVAEQELSALERRAKEQENEKLRRRSVLEGRLSSREKKAAAAEQKKSDAELKAQVVREQQIADSVLDDMPNATPNEIEAEFNRRLNEPVAPAVEATVVSDTQKRVEEKLKKEQASAEARQTRTTNARRDAAIAAARRENPEATPAEIAAIADAKLAGTEGEAAPVANENARERARQMGLGMAGQEAAAQVDAKLALSGALEISRVKRRNGAIGTQGVTEYQVRDVLRHAAGMEVADTASMREMVDALKADPAAQQRLRDFTEANPVEYSVLPDGTVHLEDGHHRTFLLDQLGDLTVPAVDRETAKARASEAAKLADTEATPAIPRNEDARARAKQMGLGMAGQEAAAHSGLPESDVEGLRRIGEAGRSIAARQTKESVGVENLLAQGKLVITTNGEFVGRENTGMAGEYDPNTNRMYIYLDNLGDKDIVQGILEEIGTHESTHLGSFNSREGRSAVMSALMGDGDVAGAAQRIRDAAANGNTIAKAALEKIPTAEREGAVGDLELLAYFTNAVRANRKGTLGSVRGVASDMVANVRNVLREKVGLDLDISINDLANAVSDVTMEAARTDTSGPINTVEGFNNQTLDDSLGMVLSTTAKEFPEQNKNGRVYKGMRDGKRRFVISDKEALTTHDPETIDALLKGEEVPLGEVLQHQRLYDNLPWLMDGITVRMDDTIQSAQFEPTADDPRRGTIAMSRRNAAQLDTPEARNTILHEVQHAVQNEVGLSSGANIERFIPSKVKSELKRLNKALDAVIARFDLTAALEAIPPAMRQEVEGVFSDRSMSLPEKREYILRSGLAADSSNRAVSTFAKNVYAKARQEQNDAARAYNEAYERAKDAYARAYGEAEARTTEQTSDLTQKELDSRPFETRFGEKPYFENEPVYDVNVEDTYDADSVRAGVQPPKRRSASPSLGMAAAAEATNMSTEGFKRWWRNGKVKNEDGSPMRLFHGTRAGADYSEFRIGEGEIGIHVGTAEQAGDPAFVGSLYGRFDETVGKVGEGQAGPRIHPVYINLQNPLRVETDNFGMGPSSVGASVTDALRREGHYKQATDWDYYEAQFRSAPTAEQEALHFGVMRGIIEEAGFDGLVYKNTAEGTRMEPAPGESPAMSRLHYPYGAEEHADSYVVFHPNQIKSVNNSGEFSLRTNNTLGMASPKAMAKRAIASARAIVDTKSDKERLYRLLRHQRNSNTADIAGAESVFSQLRKDRAAHPDPVAYDAAVTAALDGKPDPKFKENFPVAAQIVEDFRNEADANAKDIVRGILKDAELNGRDLTAEENSIVNKLLDNLGKYTHRAYSTLQGGQVGALARKERLEALDLLRAGSKDVPRRLRSDYDAVVKAADYLSERLSIPPDAELEMSNIDALSTLYDTWVGDSSKVPYDKEGGKQAKKDAMIEAIAAMRDRIGEGVLNEKAYEAIETLMGVHDNSPYGKISRGTLSDTGVMKRRNQIPPVIRELLGEFTDPSSRILTTLAEQSGWLARQKMLTELAENSNGILVASPQYVAENGRGEFTKKLDSSYGAVAGWYATPETFDSITDLTKLDMSWREALSVTGQDILVPAGKAVRIGLGGAAWVTRKHKALRIKWNPWAWARDIVGSPLFLIQNGNFHGSSYAKGLAGAKDYIGSASSSRITPTLEEVIRWAGVESARIGEIQHIYGEDLANILKGLDGDSSGLKEYWTKADRTVSAGKAVTDNWTRIANFYARVQDLSEFYDKKGESRTREQILREAGEDTDYTNVSYGRIAAVAAGAEKAGMSTYLPFNLEVWRTAMTNYAQAYADIQRARDPSLPSAAANKMLRMGVNRLVGNTLALSSRAVFVTAEKTALAMGIMSAAMYALNGDGEDDEEDKWRRRLLSDMNTSQDLRHTGFNEDGMPTYMPFGQIDPHGPITDVLRTAMTTPGTPQDRAAAVGKQLLELYIAPSWPGRVWRAATGREPESAISRTFPDAYKAFEKLATSAGAMPSQVQRSAFAAETFLPGFVSAWDPKAAPGDGANVADRVLNKMGLRYEQLRPEARLASWAYDANNERTSNHQELNSIIANQPELSETVLKRALVEFEQNEMDRLREVWKTRRTLEAWGIEEGQIKSMMKDAKFSERDIKSIYSDDPKAVISVQALERYVSGKNDGATRSAAREETYKENLRKLKASREWLASLGIELEN